MHTPHQLRIDIHFHGGRVVYGVILPLLRETVFPDTFHFMESKAQSSARERQGADANHLELSSLCEGWKGGRPEGARTESQPYLKRQPSVRSVGR